MHSNKFRDPLISRAQPVTIITPVVDETLRMAGVSAVREQIVDRFMNGQPRIAVVHGGEDHPPNLGARETIRRMIRQIWANGAIPFEASHSSPCEELSYGTEGMNYALLSRNFYTAALASLIEAHAYDGAIVLGVCDKMMVGSLRALVEVDLAHQRRKMRPVFAVMIPSLIGREAHVSEEDKRKFDPLRHRLTESERAELDELFQRPMKSHVYAEVKTILDRCFHRRIVQENEKDDLERVIAKCSASPGANCAASEASMAHRMILASFGIVPKHLDICVKAPSDNQTSDVVQRLLQAITKRERRISVASLTRYNLVNAAAVWSATGGHPAWLLHLTYLADAVGKKLSIADVTKKTLKVPQILAVDDARGNSVYSMAVETENGGNSGIDTIMRTLAEKRLIEDRAPTLDGPWMERIMEARSANGNFVYSTMSPFLPTCGLKGMQGNICTGAVARLSSHSRNRDVEQLDRKIYLAIYYLGQKELHGDLAIQDGILDRLKRKVAWEDLCYTWQYNWHSKSPNGSVPDVSEWNKAKLWDYLLGNNLLRVMVVVAGAGPHGAGMPELQLALNASSHPLGSMCVLVTDGRVAFRHEGLSIAHVVPEAFDGGGLAAIRTGDWIHLDLAEGVFQVVTHSARGYKVLASKELSNRPDRKKRMNELQRRRLDFLPSFRILLDQVSSAESGVSPASKS
ncbi:MAG TPA: dihydroxy-acid dehydratase [Terriglobia bacterium]|jgi:dihydroxyacid dehydratase/phosphogluconate dehydratase